MKRRKFFSGRKENSPSQINKLKTAYGEISNDFAPVFNKSKSKFMRLINKNPKLTFACMMIFLSANFAVLYFFTGAFKSGTGMKFPESAFGMYGSSFPKETGNEISNIGSSIADYRKAVALRDSLQYLMGKKTLSRSDTMLFIRIMEELAPLNSPKGEVRKIKSLR